MAAPGRVNQCGYIQFHQFFIKWIPKTITQPRRRACIPFGWVGIDQASYKPKLLYAALKLFKRICRAAVAILWQACNAAKTIWKHLALAMDYVVYRSGPSLGHLRWLD